jgi:GT2 family glycosyltransferase
MPNPHVSIIILNWNNASDTLRCLASVVASDYAPYEAIVVDNASQDDSVVVIRERYPQVKILRNVENLGYADGNNVGIAYALDHGADYALVLNDDTVVAPDMLSALVRAAEADPRAGMLGPKVYSLEEPQVLLTTGAELAAGSEIINPAMGTTDRGQWDKQAEVGYLWGCAVLARRQVIQKVGMLDPRFFAYQEDIDWCYRIRAAGYKCLFVPEAHCWHPDTRPGRGDSALVTYYMSRNHLLFVIKHRLGARELIRSLAVYMRRVMSWSLRPKWRHKRPQRDALVRAMLDFALGRYGKAKGFG